MSSVEINQVLQEMRNMTALAENKTNVNQAQNVSGTDFAQLLKDSVNHVANTQKAGSAAATAFEAGDPSVNISEVMIALQKASVSFQAMSQVRNSLLTAYRQVMNMPV